MATAKRIFRFNPHFALNTTYKHRIDLTTDGVAGIFQAPHADSSIAKIGYMASGVTLSPEIKVELQGVSSADPNGTAKSGATGTDTPADGWRWVTLGTPYTPSVGEYVAGVVQGDTGTDASNYLDAMYASLQNRAQAFPLGKILTAGTWSEGSGTLGGPAVALQYSTGEVIGGGFPVTIGSSLNVTDVTDPDEVGTYFTAEAGETLVGAFISWNSTNAANSGNLILYTQGTDAATQSVAYDQGNMRSSGWTFIPMPSVLLTTGQDYRLVIKPDASSLASKIIYANYFDTDLRDAGFGNGFRTERVNGTVEADWDDSNTTETVAVIPIFSTLTAAAGGGGLLVHPGMAGGMNG